MSSVKIYQLDAFTTQLFSGNPAAVCPLDDWPETPVLQRIASENNLSETAFFVGRNGDYELRWFTPQVEVNLCGHATLATAAVIFATLAPQLVQLNFKTRSGRLTVVRETNNLAMDLPAQDGKAIEIEDELVAAIGARPIQVLENEDWLLEFETEDQVANLKPRFEALARLPARGFIATAPGKDRDIDFVSRFFAPAVGINEDPVTGSAHCMLTPFWTRKLGWRPLKARQISQRGGELECEFLEDRVVLRGHCVEYMRGELNLSIP